MSTYRYSATDIVTGRVKADWLPLNVQSFSRAINSAGVLTGALDLTISPASNAAFLQALEPTRTVLWCLQDNIPVWSGILWDWTHSTISSNDLPFSAQTMESLFSRRLISDDMAFIGADVFDIFRAVLNYGLNKAAVIPGAPAAASAVSGLVIPGNESGAGQTVQLAAADLTPVYDVWNNLITASAFEYTFEPGTDASGNFTNTVRLGLPHIGRGAGDAQTGLYYPGNVLDYGYPRTGSQGANGVITTSNPNGFKASWESAYPHGADLTALAQGYPLLEMNAAYNGTGITAQSQIDGYADGQLALLSTTQTLPLIVLGGGSYPLIRDIRPGDWVSFAATSLLHPETTTGQPGLQLQCRVTGWTVYPPNPSQSERIELQIGEVRP